MNTLMVLVTLRGFPRDIRIEKEARVLMSHGIHVYLLSGSPKRLPKFEVIDGINVYRMRLFTSRPIILSYALNHIMLLLYLTIRIVKNGVQVVHVHDLQYALITTVISRFLRKKVIFDTHEHAVSMLREDLKRKGFLRRVYFAAFLCYYIFSERIVCRLASRIIVVVDENRDRLVRLNVPEDKIVVVSNTPDIAQLNKLRLPFAEIRGKFVVSYVGGFEYLRGLDTLIEALPLVVRKNPDTCLLLVGNGVATLDRKTELLTKSKKLGLENCVTFTGWVSFDEAMRYIQESKIGVLPYRSVAHTNCTVPHKLFQYMFYRKPVIVSAVKPLRRIVTETGCGFVFRPGDHEDLAQKILEAMSDFSRLEKMGENGRRAVEKKYNWSVDGDQLLSIYEKMHRRMW